MSTFDDDETGQVTSSPIEAYEFIGSATTWRVTSAIAAVTIDGNSYTPTAGVVRSSVVLATVKDAPTLTVQMPISHALVQHYGFQTPPRSLRCKVYRYQPTADEYIVEWDGEVTSLAPKGLMAEIRVPSALGARLGTSVPTLTIRKHCLHALYDARCRVARASFDLATTVASVSATDGRIVTVAGIGGNPDQWFRAGEIVRDSDGERRSIVDQTGAVLKLVAPFRTLANPDPVTLYAGCDHKVETCDSKFANTANFSGFSTMPKLNPFRVPLRLGGDA